MTNSNNTGNYNTGDYNVGSCNVGDYNAGDYNTGDYNVGSCNVGSWNNCSGESGFFNTVQSEEVRVFNSTIKKSKWLSYDKPNFLYFNLTIWVEKSEMTDQEKEDNPMYKNTGGYIKKYAYKKAFKKSWDDAGFEDKKKILSCPNFSNDVFLEISGIDVEKELSNKKVTIELTQEQLEKIKHLL